jgi:hypothetical protein
MAVSKRCAFLANDEELRKRENFLHLQGSGLAEKLAQVPCRGIRLLESTINLVYCYFVNSTGESRQFCAFGKI